MRLGGGLGDSARAAGDDLMAIGHGAPYSAAASGRIKLCASAVTNRGIARREARQALSISAQRRRLAQGLWLTTMAATGTSLEPSATRGR
jgi:sulfur relay (sulfurtransferase) complex TusBCD TusD component (DsrE family)